MICSHEYQITKIRDESRFCAGLFNSFSKYYLYDLCVVYVNIYMCLFGKYMPAFKFNKTFGSILIGPLGAPCWTLSVVTSGYFVVFIDL